MSVIDEIKARIDIVDLVSETVQLRRSGKSYTGFCPFHSNTRTPAFAVFPDTGTWRCFGQCNEGGDIFNYVMKKENLDFAEALQMLADKAGVELQPRSPAEQAVVEEHENLRALLEDAVTYYRHQLLNTPPGVQALEYLHKRGLTDETIEAFGLGYAPNSWDLTHQYFLSKGYSQAELIDTGLVSERDADSSGRSGGVYDRFRHRVIFPIRDLRGRMAGFGARILDPNDFPKFLNSPQTVLFDKGHLLYGLDRARQAIRSSDQAVIVEGYLDVIALHQAGFENAVSPMGTALTDQQLYLLKRYSRRIVLALDADAAGDKATLRGLEIARKTLDRSADPVFDARGLLGYEARLQADIRVTTLPDGMDPDEVVNEDPKEWERILENARPIVVHVMQTLSQGRDLEDAKVKQEIASQVLPLIRDLPSPIERDTYRQQLARLLRLDERTLLADPAKPSRPPRRTRSAPLERAPQETPIVAAATSHLLEAHALGVLLRYPDMLYMVDRAMHAHNLGRISHDDFQHADHKAIFRLLAQSIDQDIAEPLHFVMNSLSLPMMEVADTLLAQTINLDPVEERVLSDLVRTILDLRLRSVNQNLEYLRHLIQEAQDAGGQEVVQYSQSVVQHIKARELLDRALGFYTSRMSQTH
jgi:DNA primase